MPKKEPDRDALFIEIALDRGFLDSEKSEECRNDQVKLEKMGYSRSMMQIAVEKGFIDQAKVVEIRREMQKRGVLPRIGGYELISKLGQGGMGAVYKARQLSLDRIVALKLLPPELARDKKYVERFRREGLIAAKITHPNAVQVIDVGESGGRHYMVMEYVDGVSTDKLLSNGPLPEKQALEIVRGVLEALKFAHQSGIIHRDIKPANILIDKEGRAKLADLGIARQSGIHGGTLTGTGAAIGTPHYMSPEQCEGSKDLDARADIYSLGATLYHLCCGEQPYAEIHPAAVMHYQMKSPTPDPREKNPNISPVVAALIERMMSKKREARPQSCAVLLIEINDLLRGKTTVAGAAGAVRAAASGPTPTGASSGELYPITTPRAATIPKIFQRKSLKRVGVPLAAALFIIFAIILFTGSPKESDPFAQFETARERADESLHEEADSRQDDHLLALYNATWRRAEYMERSENWTEALDAWNRLRMISDRMSEKPASSAQIDQRFRRAMAMLRTSAEESPPPDVLEEPVAIDVPAPVREEELPQVDLPPATVYTEWPFDSREARRRQEETARRMGIPVEMTIDLGEGVALEMILIPAGEFIMGGPGDESRISRHEAPQRRMRITQPFYMGKYEVTQSQWRRVMGTTATQQRERSAYAKGREYPVWEDPDNPIHYVSWNEAQAFVVGAGNNLRLPTEAEWEYACRAGTSTRFYSGDEDGDLDGVGWHSGNSGGRMHPVGQKAPNAWGLYDMHGNVWEWVSDGLQDPYPGLERPDPIGPQPRSLNTIRGGDWSDHASHSRSASRRLAHPFTSVPYMGFRVAAPTIPASAEPEVAPTAMEMETPAPVDEEVLPQVDLPTATVYTEWPFVSREAQRRQQETARTLGVPVEKTFDLGDGVELEMILIPAGEFIMGSPDTEEGRFPSEGPQRRVRITQPFYMGKYPVTQAQWRQIMGTTVAQQRDMVNPNWSLRGEGSNYPMYSVSWNEAQEFIRRADNNLRLPTEAEWEYACRAGTITRFYSGNRDRDLDGVGWHSGNSGGRTQPVGQKRLNAWGLHDMHGNVYEWVSDWRQDNYRGLETTDPQGPATGAERVIRGGSWDGVLWSCRSAFRLGLDPSLRLNNLGFRVLSPTIPTSAEPVVAPTETVYTDWPFDSREAQRRQLETARTLGIPVEKTIDLGGGVELEMILIPAGEFIMGSPDDEEGRTDWEGPQRRVRITQPFYMGKYEVTQAQYLRVMGTNPSNWQGANLPVNLVLWHDAQAFVRRARNNLRLPTEAEWEYACRAGTSTRFYSGDRNRDLDRVGWHIGNSGMQTHPVGQKSPNAWGLHDMHGNVYEWVSDWLHNYRGLETTDPQGPATGDRRVLRGGSLYQRPRECRSAMRSIIDGDHVLFHLGFRVVSPVR